MINREAIEKKISHLLQRNVKFIINNKVVRSGRLVIFNIKDFYTTFTISGGNNRESKVYELPYPFSVNILEDGIEFDYTLETLSKGNKMLMYKLKVLNRIKKNKMFDNKVKIQYDI
jgi:hypothetical protein